MNVKRLRLNRTKMVGRILMVLVIMLSLTMAVKSSASGQSYDSYKEVLVVRGDTLWDLSKKYRSDTDIQKTIIEIKELNNMKTSDVYPGQKIRIPVNI